MQHFIYYFQNIDYVAVEKVISKYLNTHFIIIISDISCIYILK